MGSGRFGVQAPGTAALLRRSLHCVTALFLTFSQLCGAFNLDVETPAVYSGPTGSYFGYAVDFYVADPSRYVILQINCRKCCTFQVPNPKVFA